ncbi:NAD-dependent epimerase/dehydratase family protein [Halobacteriovorax sp. YZS-1-1]|uniref:NAD-dependent epimerase/dehydratase family protein n=1 Tax=unclassified Halobacteriovorax TaxID=2639665 RepID=UPI003999E75E
MKVLILGATGLVGSHILSMALSDDRVERVIAPVRKNIDAHPKLFAPIINFDEITKEEVCSWKCDVVICALGTTIKKAGSKAAFRRVDLEYPLTFGKLAKECAAKSYVLNSAMGANSDSLVFYNKVKGLVEEGLQSLNFDALTIVRPGLIGGQRDEFRFAEEIAKSFLKILGPLLPKRLRLNPAKRIAQTMLESALSDQLGVKIISSDKLV